VQLDQRFDEQGVGEACSRSTPSSRATIALGEDSLYELKASPAGGLRPGNDTTVTGETGLTLTTR
jgi:hypothetical protein